MPPEELSPGSRNSARANGPWRTCILMLHLRAAPIFSQDPRLRGERFRLPACDFQDPMVITVSNVEDARAVNIDTVRAIELGF